MRLNYFLQAPGLKRLVNAQQQDLGTLEMVVFIQNSYIAQTFVWLVATALITIHGLGLRIRIGIPLAYASVMFQLVFAVAVNNELTDKGFEGDIIIPLRLMMVITVLLYMIQQRAWAAEIAQTKEFTIRIRTEEERQTAQKALDVVSKKKGSVVFSSFFLRFCGSFEVEIEKHNQQPKCKIASHIHTRT